MGRIYALNTLSSIELSDSLVSNRQLAAPIATRNLERPEKPCAFADSPVPLLKADFKVDDAILPRRAEHSRPPEVHEPIRRKFGIANRVLNVAMAKVGL